MTSQDSRDGTAAGGASAGASEGGAGSGELSKEELIKKLSGGAGIDPLTKTVGGPDSPSGVSLTEGGAVGAPLAYQDREQESEEKTSG